MDRHRLDGRKFRYGKKIINKREERYEYSLLNKLCIIMLRIERQIILTPNFEKMRF